ncbi:hypothetical protein BDW75DRAFT_237565 [Aspergillus navahoensis]
MNNPAAETLTLSSDSQPSTSDTLSAPAALQMQLQAQSQSQPATSQQPQQAPVHQDTQKSHATHYPHQIHGNGGPTATAPFLRDFSLVAEAAKRAQIAIVTRDLEGVSL